MNKQNNVSVVNVSRKNDSNGHGFVSAEKLVETVAIAAAGTAAGVTTHKILQRSGYYDVVELAAEKTVGNLRPRPVETASTRLAKRVISQAEKTAEYLEKNPDAIKDSVDKAKSTAKTGALVIGGLVVTWAATKAYSAVFAADATGTSRAQRVMARAMRMMQPTPVAPMAAKAATVAAKATEVKEAAEELATEAVVTEVKINGEGA